ncbi:hypothetical protein GMST_25790 [Geomonas silvestris]|uniref:Lipoprotein n=1 Tax=Geomonas silvestris TaxID=2740184 RepID=A0A6V8MJY8_9BACT|nr:hypothetical protein [Geomonas silvestris]GFO60254.1 hypothetical protein GMST_25790 [Geomonas silvestris]
MSILRLPLFLFLLAFSALAGCAPTLRTSQLPPGFSVQPLAKIDAGSAWAVNGNGTVAAVHENQLNLVVAAPQPGIPVAPAPALVLAFSPKGDRLAAAFAEGAESSLCGYDTGGRLLAATKVPGRVTAIVWRSDAEILATSLSLKRLSIGCELSSFLVRWDLKGAAAQTMIFDVTVRPELAKLPETELYRTLNFALSPYGDEIAYTALKDPPLSPPYERVALRHLESGAEKVVTELPLFSGGPAYLPDGNHLLVGTAGTITRKLKLPSGNEVNAWTSPGDQIAVSPSGGYLLLDNRLYQGNQELFSLPRRAQGSFLPDGSGLVVADGGNLFLVSGLNDQPRPALPGDLDRILELRRLFMQGVISDAEYKGRLKTLSQP